MSSWRILILPSSASLRCVFGNGGWNRTHKTHKTSGTGGLCMRFGPPTGKTTFHKCDPNSQNTYTKNTKIPRPDFCAFCVRFLTLAGAFSRGHFLSGRCEKRTQKTQKSNVGDFCVFCVRFSHLPLKKRIRRTHLPSLPRSNLGELQGRKRTNRGVRLRHGTLAKRKRWLHGLAEVCRKIRLPRSGAKEFDEMDKHFFPVPSVPTSRRHPLPFLRRFLRGFFLSFFLRSLLRRFLR